MEETPTPAAASSSDSSGLDFDAQPSIEVKLAEAPAETQAHRNMGTGVSFLLVTALFLSAWFLTKRVTQNKTREHWTAKDRFAAPWHLLSFIVSSFLGLNVFFGGLSALLLTGRDPADADAYFLELSAFKMARLSHEHFFGYGISFGLVTLLAFVFVGPSKRVVFPMLILFGSAVLDVASWWLSHYASLGFHVLAVAAGAGFSSAFLCLYFLIASKNIRAILANESVKRV